MSECNHVNTRVKWMVVECQDCGHMHNLVITTPLARFSSALQSVYQGRVDRETALLDPAWSDDQRRLLSTIPLCPHEQIDQYDCSCTGGKRWRCIECGLSTDLPQLLQRKERQ